MRKYIQNNLLYIDECVEKHIVDKLLNKGYFIYDIKRFHSGESDDVIREMLKEHDGILLTKDHDFLQDNNAIVYRSNKLKRGDYTKIEKKIFRY